MIGSGSVSWQLRPFGLSWAEAPCPHRDAGCVFSPDGAAWRGCTRRRGYLHSPAVPNEMGCVAMPRIIVAAAK